MFDKTVVVVGAGFGGLSAARVLCEHANIRLIILDRQNHHLFQPLLYQVATAGLNPSDIATPIRHIFRSYSNVEVYLSEADLVKFDERTIVLKDGNEIRYDYLLLACGSRHSYFGHEEWEPNAPGLESLEQALEIRRRVLSAFELAESSHDPELQQSYLTFVVVGGGPSGVEIAGAIGELTRYTLVKDFRRIDSSKTRIVLLEAADGILPSFDKGLGRQAVDALRDLGVQVMLKTRAEDISELGVRIAGGFISARTVIWAAGVKPAAINEKIPSPKDSIGRIIVDANLRMPGRSEVYVIGDQAHFEDTKHGTLAGLAPVAIQQGRHAAANILAEMKNKSPAPFRYTDKGQLATIGRKTAVLEWGKSKIFGFSAWLIWLLVHIYYLIGFKNRFFVILQWAWSYVSFGRGARLIMHRKWRFYSNKSKN